MSRELYRRRDARAYGAMASPVWDDRVRTKELKSKPWPEGVHFEDMDQVEGHCVVRLAPETTRSYCGNSSYMAMWSVFAK